MEIIKKSQQILPYANECGSGGWCDSQCNCRSTYSPCDCRGSNAYCYIRA